MTSWGFDHKQGGWGGWMDGLGLWGVKLFCLWMLTIMVIITNIGAQNNYQKFCGSYMFFS